MARSECLAEAAARSGELLRPAARELHPERKGRPLSKVPYKWFVAAAFIFGLFMDIMDTTIVNVALPTLGRDVPRRQHHARVGGHRLPAQPGGLDPGLGLDRRPLRHQEDLPVRAGDVHARLGAVRPGVEHRLADRLPRAAGRRRRHADAGRHGDAVPRLPAGRAGPGLGGPDRFRPCSRRRWGRSSAAGWSPTSSWRWIFYVNLPIGIARLRCSRCSSCASTASRRAGPLRSWGFVCSGGGLALVLLRALARARGRLELAARAGAPGSPASLLFVRAGRGRAAQRASRCWTCGCSPTACSATPT